MQVAPRAPPDRGVFEPGRGIDARERLLRGAPAADEVTLLTLLEHVFAAKTLVTILAVITSDQRERRRRAMRPHEQPVSLVAGGGEAVGAPRLEGMGDLDAAGRAADRARQSRGTLLADVVPARTRCEEQTFPQLDNPGLRDESRPQDQAVLLIDSFATPHQTGCEPPDAAAPTEQPGKPRVAIESFRIPPHHCAGAIDERTAAAVAQEGEVGNSSLRVHQGTIPRRQQPVTRTRFPRFAAG